MPLEPVKVELVIKLQWEGDSYKQECKQQSINQNFHGPDAGLSQIRIDSLNFMDKLEGERLNFGLFQFALRFIFSLLRNQLVEHLLQSQFGQNGENLLPFLISAFSLEFVHKIPQSFNSVIIIQYNFLDDKQQSIPISRPEIAAALLDRLSGRFFSRLCFTQLLLGGFLFFHLSLFYILYARVALPGVHSLPRALTHLVTFLILIVEFIIVYVAVEIAVLPITRGRTFLHPIYSSAILVLDLNRLLVIFIEIVGVGIVGAGIMSSLVPVVELGVVWMLLEGGHLGSLPGIMPGSSLISEMGVEGQGEMKLPLLKFGRFRECVSVGAGGGGRTTSVPFRVDGIDI